MIKSGKAFSAPASRRRAIALARAHYGEFTTVKEWRFGKRYGKRYASLRVTACHFVSAY